ncbi:MAG TPA: DNA repair protein RecO [Kiritimatiellae bacterium]|nr:DNA repair protein RecO [Kiritimatiellia bacterium]
MDDPIARSPAIVLDFEPAFTSSRRVTWFTRHYGRVVTLIRGSQRPKSFFLAQYDLFYTCDLLFYRRGVPGSRPARECAALKRRDRFRRDWRACAVASCVSDLVCQVAPLEAPEPRLYRLLEQTYDHLDREGADTPVLYRFELSLLRLTGHAPRLTSCSACGAALDLERPRIALSCRHGGALCDRCAAAESGGIEHLDQAAFQWLLRLCRGRAAQVPDLPADRRLARVVGRFLTYHLGVCPHSRIAALRILDYGRSGYRCS